MTTKRMEEINRRTRIVHLLMDRECVHDIAKSEGVTAKYVMLLAKEEYLPRCNHMNSGYRCVKHTPNKLL